MSRALPILLALLLAGCSPRPEIRIGLNGWPGYDLLHLAQVLGYFGDEGVAVRIVDLTSLADSRRAYERGQVDAIGTTPLKAIIAHGNSRDPLRIVQVIDFSDGADVILARSGIKTVADLRGRSVGVEPGSVCLYVLSRALEQAGLSLDDVNLVAQSQTSLDAGMRNGLLDAIVSYPPVSTLIARDGVAAPIFSSATLPGEVVDVLAFNDRIIKQRPQEVAGVIRGFYRARVFLDEHPGQAIELMRQRAGLTAEEYAAALGDGIRFVDAAGQRAYLGPRGSLGGIIHRTSNLLLRLGVVDSAPPPEALFTDRFAGP